MKALEEVSEEYSSLMKIFRSVPEEQAIRSSGGVAAYRQSRYAAWRGDSSMVSGLSTYSVIVIEPNNSPTVSVVFPRPFGSFIVM